MPKKREEMETIEKSDQREKREKTPKKEKNKNNLPKPSSPKKTEKQVSSPITSSTVKNKIISNKQNKPEEVKIHEATVIEKIKNFIAKVIAMQEETQKEEEKEIAKTKTITKKQNKNEHENKEIEYLPEYYDLPYRYNETTVKILAQTPKRLFVYWDISDKDKAKYIKNFGEDFFEKTYPVLLLYNTDNHTTTEIPINDFANSWYIDVKNPKTKYTIQLGRKFKQPPTMVNLEKLQQEHIILRTDYLPIADSNVMEVPNDHILFEKQNQWITFRNVKTQTETVKEIKTFSKEFGKTYHIKAFYKEMYQEEIFEDVFEWHNPTSGGLSSSTFK